jgi:hypothetical protein
VPAVPAVPQAAPWFLWPLLVGGASFLFFLWMLAPGIFWLDSAEFVATSARATVPHPPGSPLFVLLAHFFSLLPLGSLALRANLLSAALGGLTMGLLTACASTLLAQLRARNPWTLLVSTLILALLPLSEALWFNAIRAEVYTLQFSLGTAILLLGLRGLDLPLAQRTRLRAGVAFLVGLGVCNHYYLTLLLLPVPLLFLWLPQRPADQPPRPPTSQLLRDLLLAPAPWFLAGLLPLVFLPLRAALPGEFAWADTSSLRGFLELLSAKAFHLSLTEMPVAPLPEALIRVLSSWFGLLSPVLVFAGFLGLGALLLVHLRLGLGLFLLLAGGLLAKAIMYLDTDNPDDHAYFMLGLEAVILGAVALVALVARTLVARPQWWLRALAGVPLGLALVAMMLGGLGGFRDASTRLGLTGFFAPDVLNRQLLERLPPDTLFMPSYYPLFFNHVYYSEVEHRRPDVTLLHQSFFSRISKGRPYAASKLRQDPRLKPVLEAWNATGTFPLKELQALPRKVILEAEVLDAPGLPKGIAPGGPGLELPWTRTWFAGSGLGLANHEIRLDNGATVQMLSRYWTGFYRELQAQGRLHPETRKLLVYLHFRDALYFLNRGQWKEAILEAGLVSRLYPEEARFASLLAFASAKDPSFAPFGAPQSEPSKK